MGAFSLIVVINLVNRFTCSSLYPTVNMSDKPISSEKELLAALSQPDSAAKIAQNERLRQKGIKIVLAVGGAALGLTLGAIPFCLPVVRKVCVPYVPATPVQINNIINCLKTQSVKRPNGKVIDLGSGDGRVCFAVAKEGYKATGVELNSVLWTWSNILKYTRGFRSTVTFRKRNLFNENLGQYDAVTVFGAPTLMQALEPKVNKECSANTKLVVCRYPFLKWAPNYTYGNGIDCVWVYHKPFIPNETLPAMYLDLVEFANHPLHPSNKPELSKTERLKDVTESVEGSEDAIQQIMQRDAGNSSELKVRRSQLN